MKKRLSILGSTGSIGVNTLKLIQQSRDAFEVVGLAAGKNLELLKSQINLFNPTTVSVATEALASTLKKDFPNLDIGWGDGGNIRVATLSNVDWVMSALVGARGILPTLAAIRGKKNILLANKEVLVVAGSIIMKAVSENKVTLLPIDSEHSAIHQIVGGPQDKRRSAVKYLTLTASGGPFLRRPLESFQTITVEEALQHPRWSMGPRITIDSATLMNKGFELIEAYWLFHDLFSEFNKNSFQVLIHPQSIIHGLVTYEDGNILACLSVPDMKAPIAAALCYPNRARTEVVSLDLAKIKELTFEEPDVTKFPLLKLAYAVMKQLEVYPCLLNAADEVAVEAFLQRKISFLDIIRVIEGTISSYAGRYHDSLEALLEADAWARRTAHTMINQLC